MASWDFKLQAFHNKLFNQFTTKQTVNKDGKLLEQLLNWLYYDASINMKSNSTISNLLNTIATTDQKTEIRALFNTRSDGSISFISETASEQGDYTEQAVALLGHLLAGIGISDKNSSAIVGHEQRVLELPKEIAKEIVSNLASLETTAKISKNKTNDFVYTSPVQAKIDVDYTRLTYSLQSTINEALIQRLLSYKFTIKAYDNNTVHLEDINWRQAVISILSTIYPRRTAHKISLWYENKIKNGVIYSDDDLGVHIDHVVKLMALTGYSGISVNNNNLQRIYTSIPDFLIINQISQRRFYVISIGEILNTLETSRETFTRRGESKVDIPVVYNITRNSLRYN